MTQTRSIEDVVDLAERNHLSAEVEADFVDSTYTTAFDLVGKHRRFRTDDELVDVLRAVCQGSIRVALLARKRARETSDLNPSDQMAHTALSLLTQLASSFIPEGSGPGRQYT